MATDRRRANGPSGGTVPQIFAAALSREALIPSKRTRGPNEIRKIFLKTGLTPSASGSAYLELEPSPSTLSRSFAEQAPTLKLTCTVHGPRPLQRSAPFTPQLQLSTRVKFAPFASRQRRGYIPDASERDLAAHLETVLQGVIIRERWPKSGVDLIVTVLESEEGPSAHGITANHHGSFSGWGLMSTLSGCITVASAAITDAGIDCVDLVTGGVAAVIQRPILPPQLVLDPSASNSEEVVAACVIGYLESRDEVTEVWTQGNTASSIGRVSSSLGFEPLVDHAIEAAKTARLVLIEALQEAAKAKIEMDAAKLLERPARN